MLCVVLTILLDGIEAKRALFILSLFYGSFGGTRACWGCMSFCFCVLVESISENDGD